MAHLGRRNASSGSGNVIVVSVWASIEFSDTTRLTAQFWRKKRLMNSVDNKPTAQFAEPTNNHKVQLTLALLLHGLEFLGAQLATQQFHH